MPHRLGAIWSSIWIPATPACSYSLTVLITLRGLPYPSSASAITGTAVACTIREALSTISVKVSSPTSGRPSLDADVPYPVM